MRSWYLLLRMHRRMILRVMQRVRRTVSLDPHVAERVDEALARGETQAGSVSRFVEEALLHYLDDLDRRRLADQASRLDPDEETDLARAATGQSWGRLGAR